MEVPKWDDLTPVTTSSEATPTWDELKPAQESESTPNWEDLKPVGAATVSGQPKTDYETPGQQALTMLEGAGQGLAGPIATGAEMGLSALGVPNLTPEDIKARKETNPIEHGVAESGTMAASMLTPLGAYTEAGLLAKGLGKVIPESLPILGKIGSAFINSGIQGIALQSGDELTKAMLGEGDPETAVSSGLARVGMAGLISGAGGAIFNTVGNMASKNSALVAIEDAKLGDRAQKVLAGVGAASKAHAAGVPAAEAEAWIMNELGNPLLHEPVDYKLLKPGVEAFYKGVSNLQKSVAYGTAGAIGSTIGGALAGPGGAVTGGAATAPLLGPIFEKVLNRPMIGLNKIVMPTVLNALSKGETKGLYTAINYATQASKGAKAISSGIDSLFKASGNVAIESATDKDIQKIKDYITGGGIDQEMQDAAQTPLPQEGLAEGGIVQPQHDDHFGRLYPEQNMMINTAKGRMSNYLKNLRPQQSPTALPFDRPSDNKTTEKNYDTAVKIAAAPLHILNHIKNGTLQTDQIKHMNGLYPELTQHLQKQMTKRMLEARMDDEKPSYKTRMAMSMFLGAPLDSTMTPMSIQAAQTAFIRPQAPAPQGQGINKPKKGTTNLGKSNKSYQTSDQSAESDRTQRD